MSYMVRKDVHFVLQDFKPMEYASLDLAISHAERLGADQVVKVTTVRTFPRLFTETERELLYPEVNLGEYASNNFCGDGLEIDLAESEVHEMDDVELVSVLMQDYDVSQLSLSENDEDAQEAEQALRQMLSEVCPGKTDEIIKEWRKSL